MDSQSTNPYGFEGIVNIGQLIFIIISCFYILLTLTDVLMHTGAYAAVIYDTLARSGGYKPPRFLLAIFVIIFVVVLRLAYFGMLILIFFGDLVPSSYHQYLQDLGLDASSNTFSMGSFYLTFILGLVSFIFPTVSMVFHIIENGFAKEKKLNPHKSLNQNWPPVVILIPVYHEDPIALWNGIESILNQNYEHGKLLLFVAFDELDRSDVWYSLLKRLGCNIDQVKLAPEPNSRCVRVVMKGVEVTVMRFPHGGKRNTQVSFIFVFYFSLIALNSSFPLHRQVSFCNDWIFFAILNILESLQFLAFEHMGNVLSDFNDELLLLFTDSDSILNSDAVHNLVCMINQRSRKMVALTGFLTCR